jgi:hypothetical protein
MTAVAAEAVVRGGPALVGVRVRQLARGHGHLQAGDNMSLHSLVNVAAIKINSYPVPRPQFLY